MAVSVRLMMDNCIAHHDGIAAMPVKLIALRGGLVTDYRSVLSDPRPG